MLRSSSLLRLLLTFALMYLFALGGTFNGVVLPVIQQINLALIALLLAAWGIGRWRAGLTWHRTPLDLPVLLWAVAFAAAFVVNLDVGRRIAMGLWFAGLYIVLWYLLYDLVANRILKRELIYDAFLLGGVIIVLFGVVELRVMGFDLSPLRLPRPGSLLGNPNFFGSFLVIMLALVAGRFFSVRNTVGRAALAFYGLVCFIFLVLTFSRGAWLALPVMVVVLSGLLVQGSGVDLRAWWRYQQPRVHAAVYGGVILAVISGLVLAVILVNSFTIEGRSAGLRTSIYADALTIFAEQPVTGRGLFTFGRELSVLQSEPPQTPHSHAHNVVLHIAAELGLIGLAAGAVTLAFLGLAMWRTWTQAGERERPLIAGAITASVGILVHLMTDFTVMQMTIANSTLLMLVLATVPPEPQPVPRSQRVAYPLAVTALGAVLVISGAWSASIHARYHQALRQAVAEGTYYEGAERLQSVIDDDPALSLYRGQQAYLYGLAANEGSADALERAISGYEQFTEMEPQWSTAWANLAALYWQADRPQDAIDAMQQAVDAAPRAWQFAFTLGSYYEASGNEAAARDAYSLALQDPFEERAALYPAWNDTALRRSVATQVEPEGESLIVVSLNTVNETDEIDALWDASGLDDAETTQNYVLRLLLALRDDSAGNLPGLWDAWLEEAERLAVTPEDRAWVHLGRAALAASNGEPEFAEEETDRAAALIAPRLGRAEYPRLVNTANLQFLRDAIPRQTLPQVYFPTADPVLVRLLSEF